MADIAAFAADTVRVALEKDADGVIAIVATVIVMDAIVTRATAVGIAQEVVFICASSKA